jgi:D-psicose/D-tagatose/L-ribulose 3-epimerase
MKLSISNIAWLKKADPMVASILFDNAIRHIDVAPLLTVDSLDDSPENFLSFWKKYDITPVGMQSLFYGRNNKFFTSENSMAETIEYFTKVISLARKMNITALVFGSPKQRILEEKSVSKELIINFFYQMANICKNQEITLCLEPNATSYGTNFLNTTLDTIKFIEVVNHPSLKLNFDTGTMLINELDPVEVYKYAAEYIGHIHISAPNLRPIDMEIFDHRKLRDLLLMDQYSSGIAIEMLTEEHNRSRNILTALKILKIYGEK